MGPNDSYMVQHSSDVKTFWADSDSLSLGACFRRTGNQAPPQVPVTEVQASSLSRLHVRSASCNDLLNPASLQISI